MEVFLIVIHIVLVINKRRGNDDETNWSVWLCGEKKTSRNISFVSIHNSLYTQCIGAPIKKTYFFPNSFFSNIFLKSHGFCSFFPPTESKEKLCTTNKRQQNMSCKSTSRTLTFISSLKRKSKSYKENESSCLLLPRTLRYTNSFPYLKHKICKKCTFQKLWKSAIQVQLFTTQ